MFQITLTLLYPLTLGIAIVLQERCCGEKPRSDLREGEKRSGREREKRQIKTFPKIKTTFNFLHI